MSEDALHSVAATAMGFAFVIGVILVALPDLRSRGPLLVLDVVAVVAAVVIPLVMAWSSWAGATQRVMFVIAFTWYIVATVTAWPAASTRPTVSERTRPAAVACVIHRRHTNRYPFRDEPIPEDLQAKLATAAEVEGAALRRLAQHRTPHVLGLVRRAERMLRTDSLYIAELAYWTGLDELA